MSSLKELSLNSKMKYSTEWFVDKFHEVKVGYNGKYECYEVTRIFNR